MMLRRQHISYRPTSKGCLLEGFARRGVRLRGMLACLMNLFEETRYLVVHRLLHSPLLAMVRAVSLQLNGLILKLELLVLSISESSHNETALKHFYQTLVRHCADKVRVG